ncbi:PREDICTED: F-box/LRR-repeat protein At2g42720-like isoform X2 [Ipomoea nil]|uniref:F-box/LRR-repeat protein At2g42720-like isoform X2 n=1 Tax=Ipomoea nil TaxID=35883 RepID=UPI000901ADC9|nr:PREDICTED: F-box/LRR-repeat protein At2g42720-like isoform X2 [Ipomoea nil]XP_019149812.1 PREDICTED: F-box/LRR-repeat protein At2g42720-like isoform X2 [Ipomoea nil]
MERKRLQRDRISELPADILDKILSFLPIQEAARMAVLSTFWRDIWFSLTELDFGWWFFVHIRKKHFHAHSDIRTQNIQDETKNSNIWIFAGLYVVNKVLIQHNGLIRKFVFNFDFLNRSFSTKTLRSRSFDFDQWLLFVTRKGVEEIHFSLMPEDEYTLPNCIFSCPTLRRLDVCGVSIGPISDPCILPNVTSLCFKNVDFNPRDHLVDVPMLENLSFEICYNLHDFNFTAQKLHSLRIDSCPFYQLPFNLDLRSIRTLDLDCSSMQGFVNGFTGRGLQQPLELDVEYLMLSTEDYHDHVEDVYSAFIHLLRICPKLCKLDIDLSFSHVMPKLTDEFQTVTQRHTMLHTLKLDSYIGSVHDLIFIKRLLACFPALEKVFIVHEDTWDYEEFFESNKEELLHSQCASAKAEIVMYNYNY